MRPWRGFGMSAFINCVMDENVKPVGWDAWDGREATSRTLEYGSVTPDGKAVDVSKRASWSKQLSADEAAKFTVANIFGVWKP